MSLFSQAGVSLACVDFLPDDILEATFTQARLLIAQEAEWTKAKLYAFSANSESALSFRVQSWRRAVQSRSETPWHMRSSDHDPVNEVTYDEFRNHLLLDHTLQEQQYIPDLIHCEKKSTLREGIAESFTMQYKMPMITSNREFAELVLTRDEPLRQDCRSFIVVSIPVLDTETSKGFVRGQYTSVELVEEVPDTLDARSTGKAKRIRWRTANASKAGGMLPQSAVELGVDSAMSKDVPAFIRWVRRQRQHIAYPQT